MSKGLIYFAVFIGGLIGSYIPVLFGQSYFSAISIIGSVVGSLAGIWAAVKLKDYI